MLAASVDALWVALPVLLGGLSHVAVLKLKVWPQGAAVALDGGRLWRNRRIFGANKTLRGLVVMVVATSFWAAVLARLGAPAGVDHPSVGAALWGAALGLGYIIGELPNSFIKRQLDVPPGAAARGRALALLWLLDQVDSLAGALLAMSFVSSPPLAVMLWLCAITLVLHPAAAYVMVQLRLKDRVG